MVKDNAYTVCCGWMRNELNLKGNELLVYSIIYGFSQGGEGKYVGSRQYLADWCGCSTRSIQTILNSLTERGLITKFDEIINGVKFCKYTCNFLPKEKISHPPGEKFSHNNIVINNIDNYIPKEKYGEFSNVRLSEEELEKLKFEVPNYESYITKLDEYIENTGKKYKNHYLTIRNWYRKDNKSNGEYRL